MNKYNLYQQAYGNDPYRKEGYYNNITNTYITLDEYKKLQESGSQEINMYQAVYPENDLKDKRSIRENKPDYIEKYAFVGKELAGVILGRGNIDKNMIEKLEITQEQYNKLFKKYDVTKINYLAEMFVDPKKQGEGIGSKLLKEYIQTCKDMSIDVIITRTTTLKENPQKMFLNNGFKKIYDYPQKDTWSRALYSLLLI